MAGGPNVMRVEMNEDHLRAMLQPILDEVNSLRARVAELESALLKVTDETLRVIDVLEVLVRDWEMRQDDGK